MKQIIDNETGEIIEVEEANEIATRKLTELGLVNDAVYEMIQNHLYYEEQYEMFRHKLEQAMRENNIKSWKTDEWSVTVTDDKMSKRLDTDRLKEDGLYDKYQKLVNVKGGIQIRFKGKK